MIEIGVSATGSGVNLCVQIDGSIVSLCLTPEEAEILARGISSCAKAAGDLMAVREMFDQINDEEDDE